MRAKLLLCRLVRRARMSEVSEVYDTLDMEWSVFGLR